MHRVSAPGRISKTADGVELAAEILVHVRSGPHGSSCASTVGRELEHGVHRRIERWIDVDFAANGSSGKQSWGSVRGDCRCGHWKV